MFTAKTTIIVLLSLCITLSNASIGSKKNARTSETIEIDPELFSLSLPNGCPKNFHEHLLLPHENDCSKFYQCVHGSKVLMTCSAGTLFDEYLQICNWPYAVSCNTAQVPTSTENSITTNEPDTTEETTTTENVITTQEQEITAPSSTENSTTQETEAPTSTENVATTQEPQTTDILTTTETSLTTNKPETTEKPTTAKPITTQEPLTSEAPTTTENSLTTQKPEATDLPTTTQNPEVTEVPTTAPNNTLEPTTTEVPIPTTTQKPITPEPPTPQICPAGVFGNVAHPERCDSYYWCSQGLAIQLYCTKGFEYDPVTDKCAEIGEGGCTLSTKPSTDATSTEANSSGTTDQPITPDNPTETPTASTNTEISTELVPEESTTTLEPTTSEPTTSEPTTSEPTPPEPTTAEPTTSEPTTIEPTTAEPSSSQPTTTTTSKPPKPPICPAGLSGNVPNLERCDSYYMCAGGMAIQLYCSQGYEFEPLQQKCVPISEGGCTLGQASTTGSAGSTDIMTTSGVTESTPEVTNVTESTTEIADNFTAETTPAVPDILPGAAAPGMPDAPEVTETVTTTEKAAPICPPNVSGNVPHPEMCDSFYMCTNGLAIQLFCSAGSEFNPVTLQCVAKTNDGCSAKKHL